MLNVRILGEQQEPTMMLKGHEMYDIQYRTNDPEAFEKGKKFVEDFVSTNFGELGEDKFYIIDDPMQITLGDADGDSGKFSLNSVGHALEKMGFFGKGAAYRPGVTFDSEFARAFNKAVSSEENTNKDGSVNWNFVDADLYGSEHRPNSDNEYYNLFNSIAIQYELSNGIIQ